MWDVHMSTDSGNSSPKWLGAPPSETFLFPIKVGPWGMGA